MRLSFSVYGTNAGTDADSAGRSLACFGANPAEKSDCYRPTFFPSFFLAFPPFYSKRELLEELLAFVDREAGW